MDSQRYFSMKDAYTKMYMSEKKDDSYLETDMKKRQANNEKARKDMEKVPGQKNPHFEEFVKEEDNKPEGGGVKHYYPVPAFGVRRPVVVNKTNVSIDVDTKEPMGPGEVDKAYYTYPAGFDPTNREDVAKKDYDGSKTRSEAVEEDTLIGVCDYLIGEGFARDAEGAEAMLDHMSEDWFSMLLEKNRCWKGYKPTPGKKAYSDGSCEKA